MGPVHYSKSSSSFPQIPSCGLRLFRRLQNRRGALDQIINISNLRNTMPGSTVCICRRSTETTHGSGQRLHETWSDVHTKVYKSLQWSEGRKGQPKPITALVKQAFPPAYKRRCNLDRPGQEVSGKICNTLRKCLPFQLPASSRIVTPTTGGTTPFSNVEVNCKYCQCRIRSLKRAVRRPKLGRVRSFHLSAGVERSK